MADMVDLKQSPTELKKSIATAAPEDYYPLSLYLGKDQIEKLGLGNCKVGDDYKMVAQVHVVSMSKSESENGGGYSSLTLQVRRAAIDTGSEKSAADTMYKD